MAIVSATLGESIATSLQLPAAAVNQVRWAIRDHTGALVVRGVMAPTGAIVSIATVLPATAPVPPDGSKYSLTASDGIVSATEYFTVLPVDNAPLAQASEVAYFAGSRFSDTLIVDKQLTGVAVSITHVNGAVLIPEVAITAPPSRRGEAYVYRYTSAGPIDMLTMTSPGTGTVVWKKTDGDAVDYEMHPFYTVTPRSADFMNGIKKLVDKARIGDVNAYLEYTTADLAHAVLRGADYVSQSQPLLTPFALDTIPALLRDYIIKAGAVDILRAQYGAEAMSQFDFQGLGVQLNVDRTAAIESMISGLVADLERLPDAKKKWLEAGQPKDNTGQMMRRPLGALAISTGTFTNQPMIPIPIISGAGGLYSFQRYGVWR